MISRLVLAALFFSLIGGVVYAASLTKVSGTATLQISFNQPKDVTVQPLMSAEFLPPVKSRVR